MGAWVVVFRKQEDKGVAVEILKAVKSVVENVYGGEGIWEGVCLAVGMPSGRVGELQVGRGGRGQELDEDAWEELCFKEGFEYVDMGEKGKAAVGRNENGETHGVERVKEALEANDWNGEYDTELGMELLGVDEHKESMEGLHGEDMGFGFERAQMEKEFMGLQMAMKINSDEEEIEEEDERMQVEKFEGMMLKMQTVKGWIPLVARNIRLTLLTFS